MSLWVVVEYDQAGPVGADGPYFSRADARGIKRNLDLEAREDTTITTKVRVVPLSRYMTHAEVEAIGVLDRAVKETG